MDSRYVGVCEIWEALLGDVRSHTLTIWSSPAEAIHPLLLPDAEVDPDAADGSVRLPKLLPPAGCEYELGVGHQSTERIGPE